MLKPLPVDRSAGDARISLITFIVHVGFSTQELAHMLDSLVRVSRRVEWNHLVIVFVSGRCPGRLAHNPRAAPGTQSTETRHAVNQYTNEFCRKHSLTRRQATSVLGVFLDCEPTLTIKARTTTGGSPQQSRQQD